MKKSAYLGVDIGGTNTKLCLIDGRGRSLGRASIETRAEEGTDPLFERIKERTAAVSGAPVKLVGVGIGCAGLVDKRRGRLLAAPNLPGWQGSMVASVASRHFGTPVVLDNDVNAAAYGEYKRGAGRGSRMFICMTLGTGVGGAVVAGGRIVRGTRNFAGEIGHMTINERGPRCRCGNRGCLEAYIAADTLVRRARELSRRYGRRVPDRAALSPQVIARAARRNDRVAREVFLEAADHLGTAIASLVNLLNPDVIAVGGGIAGAFSLMKKRLLHVVTERAFGEAARAVTIRRFLLGNQAAATGAALMARDNTSAGPSSC